MTSPPPLSLVREITLLAVVSSAQLLTQAALAQAIVPMDYIGSSFGLSPTSKSLSWFPAAYSLTVGTFILFAGRLGDLFGYRRMFLFGWIWLSLWSLLAGLAIYSGQVFFIICRAFQGIGPAILLPNALAILGQTYPPGRRKAFAFSIFGATAPGGFCLGALFSAISAEFVSWSWAYYVLAMVAAVMAALSFLIVPIDAYRVPRDTLILSMFDVWGVCSGVAGLVLFNVAWNQAAIVGWTTPYTYVLLILGIGSLAIFGFIEMRAPYPLLPIRDLSTQTLFVLGCIASGWAAFGIWVYYLWKILLDLRGTSPLLATAQYSPTAISGLIAAIVTGCIIGHVKPPFIMLFSMLAFMTGTTLLATMPLTQSYWYQTLFAVIITPWGMDMSFPSGTMLLSDVMPRSQQGSAASIVNTVVNYSISLGLGIAGTVESQCNPNGDQDLEGYRSALYVGIGLSCLGVCTSLAFVVTTNTGLEPLETEMVEA